MGQYSLVETRARMVSKKLVLALEKMIYTVHASFYMLFLIPEQLISFFLYISWIFLREDSQQGFYDIWKTTSLDYQDN